MNKLGAPRIVLGLLVLGGAAFGWLASHTADLQLRESERQAEDRARSDLDRLVARVPDRARNPRGTPSNTWRLVPAPGIDPRATADEADLLAFAEAEFAETRGDDPNRALAIYAHIATRDAGPIARLAALRAGTIARRQGDPRARALLESASSASPDIADASGLSVRVSALYHLAAMGLETDDPTGLTAFLDAIDGGYAVAAGELLYADLVGALSRVGNSPALENAWSAAQIVDQLDVLTRTGSFATLRIGGPLSLFVRTADGIECYGDAVAALARPGEDGVVRLTDRLPSAGLVFRFDAPLDGLVAVAQPERQPASPWTSEATLWAGFAVYAFGAWLAFTALRKSAKAAAMQGDFVAAVSHELKTPIASVRAMAELLAQGDPTPERTQQYAERMTLEMERLGNTVRNVLDTAQIERQGGLVVVREPADPAALVLRVGETARAAFEHAGFTFDVRAAASTRPMQLDADAITGLLVNLLDNAAKFDRDTRDVVLSGEPKDTAYRFVVEDRGPGVPVAERSRLFTRFERGEGAKQDAVPGIGLGLYVVKQVAEAHGGTVRVEDREGGGARFVVEIPGDA